ncbi:hypothetical protein [Schaedlerella arabinosiphila]|uniref:hypothetical protein n=1 Tax=Schaedlerella arabinosiphila TaxID=2044587 RepID=UPI002557E6B5|nr:hypothetical protein [Schaedlerella arabinosiphila]
MASRIKSNTKFSNVDILDFMKKVVEKHTRYYQSDFEIDKETLRRAAVKQEHQEKTFIWLCRTHGTWCLLERNVFLKDTSEYITFNYYAEQSTESVLAFVIEITSDTQDSITGNMYTLDYAAHCNHVRSVSLYPESVSMQYEHGYRTQSADDRISGYPDMEYGKLQSVQYQPHSQEELTMLLWKEQQERRNFKEENQNKFIANL